MNSLCLGGSFNPIHIGHIRLGATAARAGGFGRVILIPSGDPPHKQRASDLAPAVDRWNMCRLAIADEPLFTLNRLEIDRTGPSYTIDTAGQLRAQGLSEVHWLVGA
ncbi:MAG TPA: adenylyltransferase/cytidyltransferase family protein, partial [Tepidisphaeraceae bacterium]|nr:adenylyltransferase/cytidyltransferase family protein [Tepidisphaeraceae bacterium]